MSHNMNQTDHVEMEAHTVKGSEIGTELAISHSDNTPARSDSLDISMGDEDTSAAIRPEDGSADPVKFKIMLPPLMPAPLIPTLFMPVHVGAGAPDAQQGGLIAAVPVSATLAPDPHGQDPSAPPASYPADPLLHSIDPLSAAALAAAAAASGGGRPDEPVPTAAVCIIPPLAPPPLLRIPGEAGGAAGADAARGRRLSDVGAKREREDGGPASPAAAGGVTQSWFVIFVDEAWERQRGFRLYEMDAPPPPTGFGQVANVREWCSAQELAPPGGFQVGHQRFLPVKPGVFSPLFLPDRCCMSVNVMRGAQVLPPTNAVARFVKIDNEQLMVSRAYTRLHSGPLGPPPKFRPGAAHAGGAGGADGGRGRGGGGGGGLMPGMAAAVAAASAARLACDGGEPGAASRESMDIVTRWRCEVCNIYFTSSQALGGHRINSTDHKQRMEKLRNCETDSLPAAPRLSLYVYSNEDMGRKCKRTRLPPMAQMEGFDRVLLGFPVDVQTALARIQSPAAYFSSCSLDVFRRHEIFGEFASRIIQSYFGSSTESFENLLRGDVRTLPEVAEAGLPLGHITEAELKVFVRMLLTKKKFLDINRRAVSKRIKGIRKIGGEKLRVINSKKARGSPGPAPYPVPGPPAALYGVAAGGFGPGALGPAMAGGGMPGGMGGMAMAGGGMGDYADADAGRMAAMAAAAGGQAEAAGRSVGLPPA